MNLCKFTFVLAAPLLFHVALAWAAPAEKTSGPKVQIREADHDFGQVFEGEMLEHTFRVLNRGDQPLTIENVSPS